MSNARAGGPKSLLALGAVIGLLLLVPSLAMKLAKAEQPLPRPPRVVGFAVIERTTPPSQTVRPVDYYVLLANGTILRRRCDGGTNPPGCPLDTLGTFWTRPVLDPINPEDLTNHSGE